MRQLFPENEPEWWKQAVANRGGKVGGDACSSNHSTSPGAGGVLPGWEEVVDVETRCVSMRRVRGGGPVASAGEPWSKCRGADLGGSAYMLMNLQAVRGGWSPWSETWPTDAEVRDDSGERRLNVPDSDLSVEWERDTMPYLLPVLLLTLSAPCL